MAARLALFAAALGALAALTVAAPATAQVPCLPGVIIPGCEPPEEEPPPGEPPPPSEPPPGEPPPSGGQPPSGEQPPAGGQPPSGEQPPSGGQPPSSGQPPSESCPLIRAPSIGGFGGIVAEDVYVGDAQYRRCMLSRQVQAGVRVVRQPFRWSEIEGSQGNFDFRTYYDAYVGAIARHGLQLLPVLFDPPTWHSSRPSRGATYGTYPPRRYADMARYATVLVRRYGPSGSFWREHRDIPKVPIRAWQVWNEPNLPPYWPKGPNAAEYTTMLISVSKAIKRVDRKAEIVTAGLPQSAMRGAHPLTTYLKRMYRAGAARGFDTLAVNPYARSRGEFLKRLRSVRTVMNRNRDRRARIWITEIGWATDGPDKRFRVGAAGQARLIRQTFALARKYRKRYRIRGVVYYNWRDSRPNSGFDYWGLHTGLLDVDGNGKPGLSAFSSAAR